MTAYQRPRQRKGFTLSYVAWNRDGSISQARYDPIRKPAPADHLPEAGKKVRRGAVAEVHNQSDLFGSH